MDEIKNYIDSRIKFIRGTRGKYTVEEQELQKVLDKVNEQLANQ